jgi:hypothetical protein
MPKIFSNSLKMSLLSGLFVFVAYNGFTIYCVILCFVLCNTQVIRWYSHSITYYFQKQPSVSLKYLKSASKIQHTLVSWQQLFECLINHLKSSLYFFKHSKKHLKYCLKVLKSSLYKLKSIQKPSKAVEIYCTRLHFSIFKFRYRSFFNPNPTLW